MSNIPKYPQHEDGWPQHDSMGYFVGESRDGGGPQPNNTADKEDWPEFVPGYHPRRNRKGTKPPFQWLPGWKQIENHKGEIYYLGSQQYTMTEYGSLPKGATEYPEPTEAEIEADARAYVENQLAALQTEYLTPETIAGLAVGDEDAKARYAEYQTQVATWRERLSAIPETEGAAA